MNIAASRDSAEYSLTRVGTFKVGSTSGTIPFRVRRLTGADCCEAKFLTEDDRLHINELYRPLNGKELSALSGKSEAKREVMKEVLESRLSDVRSDVNMVRFTVPSGTKFSPQLADSIANLLYIKNNGLITPPLNSNSRTIGSRHSMLKAIREYGETEPRREIVGYLPARSSPELVQILIQEYARMGVKIFAIDVAGGVMPSGLLGEVNAYLQREMNDDFLVITINQPQTPHVTEKDLRIQGQTVLANDVASLPRGFDGYAPNRIGFSDDGDNGQKDQRRKETARARKTRIKDEKGRKRLFIRSTWGRAQVSAVLDEEPDLLSGDPASPNSTKATTNIEFDEIFNDESTSVDEFYDLLRCHDTELVERELADLGRCALEGIVCKRFESKVYGKTAMPRVVLERAAFDKAFKRHGKQQILKVG